MFSTIALALTLITAQAGSAPPPAKAQESPWRPQVISAEWVKPGTEGEPRMRMGKSVLKVTMKFEYKGPQGQVTAPVVKVTDGEGKEHVLRRIIDAGTGVSGDCMVWLASASHVRLKQKPNELDSKAVSECTGTSSYYFELPEKPKPPLALIFADAAPIPLRPK
jgi:hypothetical protein